MASCTGCRRADVPVILRCARPRNLRRAELEHAVRLLAKGEDPQRVLEALSRPHQQAMHGPTASCRPGRGRAQGRSRPRGASSSTCPAIPHWGRLRRTAPAAACAHIRSSVMKQRIRDKLEHLANRLEEIDARSPPGRRATYEPFRDLSPSVRIEPVVVAVPRASPGQGRLRDRARYRRPECVNSASSSSPPASAKIEAAGGRAAARPAATAIPTTRAILFLGSAPAPAATNHAVRRRPPLRMYHLRRTPALEVEIVVGRRIRPRRLGGHRPRGRQRRLFEAFRDRAATAFSSSHRRPKGRIHACVHGRRAARPTGRAGGHQPRRPAHRYLPRLSRRRRSTHQQDGLRGAHHAFHRHRRRCGTILTSTANKAQTDSGARRTCTTPGARATRRRAAQLKTWSAAATARAHPAPTVPGAGDRPPHQPHPTGSMR